MIIQKFGWTAATLALFAAAPSSADVAIGLGGGTTGGTAEVQVEVTSWLGLRGNVNYLSFGVDETYDDIDYDADLDFNNAGAFVDLRPFSNSFVITGGAYFGDKQLEGTAVPTGTVEVGNGTFTGAETGTLNLGADADDVAPFAGLGFDTTFQGDGRWGFKILAGAMMSGSPEITLTSTGGTLSDDPDFQAALEEERQNLQDEVDDFELYPVVQVGLTYRF